MFREEWGLSTREVAMPQERRWKKRFDDLLVELAGSALTTAIGTVIGFLVAQQPIRHLFADVKFLIFTGVATLLLWGLIHFVRKSQALKSKLKDFQSGAAFDQIKNYLEQFNIQDIYLNRLECNKIIQEKIKKSSTIRFFLLIGSEFTGKSGIYVPALRERGNNKAKVRVLIASPDSPFLSTQRISSIRKDGNKSRETMLKALEHVEAQLRELHFEMKRKGIALDWRKHGETFLCKFILFDDVVVFCFNMVTSENDRVSPYFMVKKSDAGSIYDAFAMYFDSVWNKLSGQQKRR